MAATKAGYPSLLRDGTPELALLGTYLTETSCIGSVLSNIAGARNAFYKDPRTVFSETLRPTLSHNGYNLKK